MDGQRGQIQVGLAIFDEVLIEQGLFLKTAMTKVILHTEDWEWV
jgi:hypothetical protein